MTTPPMLLYVNVASPGHRHVRLWLPLFLLWPLVILLLALPLLLLVLLDVLLLIVGQRYHHYSVLLLRTLALVGETRGMVIRVNDGETTVDVTVV